VAFFAEYSLRSSLESVRSDLDSLAPVVSFVVGFSAISFRKAFFLIPGTILA
jgi:hypothetical protein